MLGCLECEKCRKASELLHELEHGVYAELIDSRFCLGIDQEVDVSEIIRWLQKHVNHGVIRFR